MLLLAIFDLLRGGYPGFVWEVVFRIFELFPAYEVTPVLLS